MNDKGKGIDPKEALGALQESFIQVSTVGGRSGQREIEAKYLDSIKKLIDKYEYLYNAHDAYKNETTEKINYYITQNDALYSRNTELGNSNKEKNESLNKVIKDNVTLKYEMDASKVALEKVTNQLNEANTAIKQNEKFIENMKLVLSQKDAEVAKWRQEYQSLEQNRKTDKDQMEIARLCGAEREKRLEEMLRQERCEKIEIKTALDEFRTKKDHLMQTILGLEESLVQSNARVTHLLQEQDSLRNTVKIHENTIAELNNSRQVLKAHIDSINETDRQSLKTFSFEGKIVNGLKQGKGIYRCAEYVYEGEFKNDIFCGRGRLEYLDSGKKLEGEFDERGHFKGNAVPFKGFTYHGPVVSNGLEGRGHLEIGSTFVVEGSFHKDSFQRGTRPIVIDLETGDELETKWIEGEGLLVGEIMGKGPVEFEVSFKKGTFARVKSK